MAIDVDADSPPRVLHLLHELTLSGAERMLASAAVELAAAGSAIVATSPQVGRFAGDLAAAGYRIVHRPFTRSLRHFIDVAKLIRAGDFDIVHVHLEQARVWYLLLARLLGLPAIATIHAEFRFTGGLRLRKAIGRRLAALVGVRFVACSQRVARNERARFGTTPCVIANWTDPARLVTGAGARALLRSSLGLSPETFLTLSIANDAPVKNLPALVDAVSKGPPEHVHVHLGQVSAELACLVDEVASDRLLLVGEVEAIGPYLAASDAFLCSSFAEGGPLVLIEAALAGLPCVTTDVGVVEEFGSRPAMVIVEPDASAIAAGIDRVRAMTPVERRDAGAELAAFASQRYVPAVGGSDYAALYRSLSKRHARQEAA